MGLAEIDLVRRFVRFGGDMFDLAGTAIVLVGITFGLFGLVWFGWDWFGLARIGLVWLRLVWFGKDWFGFAGIGLDIFLFCQRLLLLRDKSSAITSVRRIEYKWSWIDR